MDIKAKIEELVEKIKSDKDLLAKFQADPIKAVEGLVGMDLPDDKIMQVVNGIKAKMASEDLGDALDNIGDKLEGLGGKLGGLFGKK